ncbi:MAG TPA: 6-phosphogluconolactonase [Candidatus Paceibacterota bacterium]|jgi:6-phosphogluconolactonase/glucosamine-6-phosphate isomerase/deaminase|nr:6-phosphogluconolactonase [Candidatus Paceibacterota bacterium]
MILKVNTSSNPAQHGAQKLRELLDNAEGSVLCMLSGGSAFELLQPFDISKGWERVTITVLDERYSEDEGINNFAQLAKTDFYAKAKSGGASFIDTRIAPSESENELEVRFDDAVKQWLHGNPGGSIVVTMGIGADGHTAGIFPHEDDEKFRFLFEQDGRFVVGYHAHTAEYHERLTVTNHFLREHVDHAVVFAVGEGKREAVDRVLSAHGLLSETPARIIREMKDAELFTDISGLAVS